MIGRLVEQQQVGAAPGNQRQRAARLLAAGHRPDRSRCELAGKAVLAEEVAQLLLANIGAGLDCKTAQVVERRLVGAQLVELVLSEVADGQPGAAAQFATKRLQVAGNRARQRGLASAIDPEDADPVAGTHQELHVGQDASLAGAAVVAQP